jgi:hypothetical protein
LLSSSRTEIRGSVRAEQLIMYAKDFAKVAKKQVKTGKKQAKKATKSN